MLIIGNGRMITRDASKAFIENGAVAMDGNTIVMVGTTDEVKKAYPDGEFVDARGGVSCLHLSIPMSISTALLPEV